MRNLNDVFQVKEYLKTAPSILSDTWYQGQVIRMNLDILHKCRFKVGGAKCRFKVGGASAGSR